MRTNHLCGDGDYSASFSFSTLVLTSDCPVGYDPLAVYSQSFEGGEGGWTHSGNGDTWALSDVRMHSGGWSMNADDPTAQISDQTLVSPPVELPELSGATLQFWNYQSLEDRSGGCYDGGLLEISTDGGLDWVQVETGLLTDDYDGQIASGFGNPLAGQNTWCGDPQNWVNSVVDLSGYTGQSVQFRFRLGSDKRGVVNRQGWFIDDVVVQSCALEGAGVAWSGVSVTVEPEAGSAAPGGTAVYGLEVTNTGAYTDTFSLSALGEWTNRLSTGGTGELGPGESVIVMLEVDVPQSALPGESEVTEVTVVSGLDSGVVQVLPIETLVVNWQLFMPMVIHQ